MKVTYEFADDDFEQRLLFDKGHDFYIALFDIDNLMRNSRKEDLNEVSDYEKLLEDIAERIWDSGMHSIP